MHFIQSLSFWISVHFCWKYFSKGLSCFQFEYTFCHLVQRHHYSSYVFTCWKTFGGVNIHCLLVVTAGKQKHIVIDVWFIILITKLLITSFVTNILYFLKYIFLAFFPALLKGQLRQIRKVRERQTAQHAANGTGRNQTRAAAIVLYTVYQVCDQGASTLM